jgi:hypothetical protein
MWIKIKAVAIKEIFIPDNETKRRKKDEMHVL